MNRQIVPFFIAHQGCPHQCVFCNQVKISGGKEAIPSPEEMLATIDRYRQSAPNRQLEVAFYGGTFTSLPLDVQKRLLTALRPLLQEGMLASVRISTRPDAVDASIARFLVEMGVRTVELGVQSMDDAVLGKARRGHAAADVEKAFSVLKSFGLTIGAQIMPGLPGDSPQLAIATGRRLLDLAPDFLRIYPVLVVAGTELERLYGLGEYQALDLSLAVRICKVLLHEALRASVPVIRIGLQPSEEISFDGSVIAGPYHPAFRQLVEGELFFDLLVVMTRGLPRDAITVRCSPRRISEVVGQRRKNLERLAVEHSVRIGAVRPDPSLSPLELQVESRGGTRAGSILQLHYTFKEFVHVV